MMLSIHTSCLFECVVDSVVTLLLQLDVEEVVTAHSMIMECTSLNCV